MSFGSSYRVEVHITHEKVAACPRQNQRLYILVIA
ncbi:unnamed protein product [Arabidopsis halleri]